MHDGCLSDSRPLIHRRSLRERTAAEINMLLRAHTAKTAMVFFDMLSPEDRERVREGTKVIKGYAWQLLDRDELGRFKARS